jgi:pyruvate dehydrogenase E2 component (dihydrolipoamide acetyltransferase)
MSIFTMPSLGADMEAGKLVEWLVKPGDTVSRGDIVAVVETQKGAIEIEIFEDGVVRKLLADLHEELPVGAALAEIGKPGEAPAATSAEQPAAEAPAGPGEARERATAPPQRTAAPQPPLHSQPVPAPTSPAPHASPAARSFAAERGIDLAQVRGTGPGGAIVLTDVEKAAGVASAAPPEQIATEPRRTGVRPGLDLAAMREAIAAAMARSKREIPHYYLAHEIDLQPAADWLRSRNAARGPQERLLMGALLVKAVAIAAADSGGLSGHYADGRFNPGSSVNVGVAVALRGGGLVAPAIRDASARSLDEVMTGMRDLVARARAGRLKSSEMTDGTITVSSLGEKGVDAMTGVIYPPQVALVGFGAPRSCARVLDGAVKARTVVTATLAADHRVSDGRRGGQFLLKIEKALNNPEAL